MSNKSDTLHGGREITVQLISGETKAILVRQLRVSEYRKAFPLIGDEIRLVAFASGLTEAELDEIVPEHYELLQAALWEVNAKGFFAYAARTRRVNEDALVGLPPELLKSLSDKIASTLPTPSPALPPR